MNYLVRFVHVHESFRIPELQALAALKKIPLEIVSYQSTSPFCVVHLPSAEAARDLLERSILTFAIYELWGFASNHETLREAVRGNSHVDISQYVQSSFRFTVDSFQGKLSPLQQRNLIESFAFLGFEGPIRMENAEEQFTIFENYSLHATSPKEVFFGRFIAASGRDVVLKYDLKKRTYISRTSMDAELSLITANMILAAPGKLVFDPFVGTGSFIIASAHFGAATMGSDIDGRSIRGTSAKNLLSNFQQYGLMSQFVDSFISDLTHSPLRSVRVLDAIVCDPPYGVREGPKVLGARDENRSQIYMIDGQPAHLREGYIPPKRAYGFEDMLSDILHFSATMLVDGGRLAMWMPTANDEDVDLSIPKHEALELLSVSVQPFNKWSRRLLTYLRLSNDSISEEWKTRSEQRMVGMSADELNHFRKKYFQGFKSATTGA